MSKNIKSRLKFCTFVLAFLLNLSTLATPTKLIRNQNPNNYYTPHTPQRTHTNN
jgi:hypothetical protein